MGSSTSPQLARHQVSGIAVRICLHGALHPYPRTTIAWVGLPSCVTPSLAYYQEGSRAPLLLPEGSSRFGRLAFKDSAWASYCRYGISTRCPSTTPVGLALGPDSPWAD